MLTPPSFSFWTQHGVALPHLGAADEQRRPGRDGVDHRQAVAEALHAQSARASGG